MQFWAELKRLSFVGSSEDFRELALRLGVDERLAASPQAFRDEYRQQVCDAHGWPKALSRLTEKTIAEGIRVFSVSRKIEGRTTGSVQKCRATGCPGWFIGVQWETGQLMHICSEGWHYSPDKNQIDLVGGGEISARFVSPKPLGVHPLEERDWPARADLRQRRGWRINL